MENDELRVDIIWLPHSACEGSLPYDAVWKGFPARFWFAESKPFEQVPADTLYPFDTFSDQH